MAIKWSWQFHDETVATLQTLGWISSTTANRPNTTFNFAPEGANVTGSVMEIYNAGHYVNIPNGIAPPEGAVCVAERIPSNQTYGNNAFKILVFNPNGSIYTYAPATSPMVRLYVDNVFKATGAVLDIYKWNFWTLKYSCTGSTWHASVSLNGEEYISEQTDPEVAQSSGQTVRFYGGANANGSFGAIANIIVYDAYADDSEKVRYVTRLDPNVDTSETGTWAPDSGTDNFARLGSGFNPSTYTQESSPTVGDEVITSFSGNIAASVGVTPTAVKAVTVHAMSTGLNNVTRAEVGDQGGSGTTTGADTTNGNDTTYQYATATTKPTSGGAWATSDTIRCKFEFSGSA